MYVVTGAAGFIGSNLVAELTGRGEPVLACDWLGRDERWQNLAKHELVDIVAPERLLAWLEAHTRDVRAVVHLGASSATTETDVDLITERNVRCTLDLLDWCTRHERRFIYASSAATYGDGGQGFDDEFSCEALARLRPLNAYGWSKHLIDRRYARLVQQRAALPPQCVGLKFFNVFGPNEYHKGSMRSLIATNFERLERGQPLLLFKSYRRDYQDGGQLRDFIYVADCVRVMLWLLERPKVSGLFNVGTGKARTWLDFGRALFAAMGVPEAIEFVDMPETLRAKYQYFTEARMQRLASAGYGEPFLDLETAVADYVQRYLRASDRYR